MNNGFASHCLVLTMLVGMLPAHSIAAGTDRTQGVNQAAPTAHVAQPSIPCAPATLHLGGCEQQLRNARGTYEHLRPGSAERFDDLDQALSTLRSARPQIANDLLAKGVPSWLYCVVHPLWCRG